MNNPAEYGKVEGIQITVPKNVPLNFEVEFRKPKTLFNLAESGGETDSDTKVKVTKFPIRHLKRRQEEEQDREIAGYSKKVLDKTDELEGSFKKITDLLAQPALNAQTNL